MSSSFKRKELFAIDPDKSDFTGQSISIGKDKNGHFDLYFLNCMEKPIEEPRMGGFVVLSRDEMLAMQAALNKEFAS